MKTTTRIALILGSALLPALAAAQTGFSVGVQQTSGNSTFGFFFGSGSGSAGMFCTTSICGVAATLVNLINSVLVPLLFAVAFIVFLYGVAQAYIFSRGDPDAVKQGHNLILWGIIGFVVMISLWGLVNVVANTFGLYGVSAPPLPRSY